ncbi:MAG: HAMP domain-containing histidine kinase, partial [Armatimonadetes bacterium]|nr:HAMP domain-containing histidine kinase [Armatimonadota bacterium]
MKLGLLVQQQVMPINRGLPPLAALGILAGFMALGAWLAAAHVTRPIRELRAAAARIAEGGHVKRLEIDTRDEVSALASDFNKMAEIIAQREKELTDKNAELARSSELKSQFLATVSHELRTPLTAIVGYCQVLKDGLQGPVTDGQTEVLQRIALQAEGLVHQINQLLDVTRIEAGRMELAL